MSRFIWVAALWLGAGIVTLFSQSLLPISPHPTHQSVPLCGSSDEVPEGIRTALLNLKTPKAAQSRQTLLREMRLAFDIRKAILDRFNGDKDQVRWLIQQRVQDISRTFEQTIGVRVVVAHIHFWDTADGYDTRDLFRALSSCRAYWQRNLDYVERDAVVLYDYNLPGALGYAYSLENSSKDKSYLVSNSLYEGTIGYDNLLAHELGHILGCPHTHSCYWPGGPLDSCYAAEGSCVKTPISAQRNGYLMSYCTPEGRTFHPLAQQLLRTLVERSQMSTIDQAPETPVGEYPTGHVTLTGLSAYFRCTHAALATEYMWEIASDPAFTQQHQILTSEVPMIPVYGLRIGQMYYWRVKTSNKYGNSAWGPVSQFYTRAGSAPMASMPEPLYPLYDAETAVPHLKVFRFRRVSQASSYILRFYHQGFDEPEEWDLRDTFFRQRFYRLPGKQYSAWSVQAVFADGTQGPESPRQVFLSWPDNTPTYPMQVGTVPNSPFPISLRLTSFPDTALYQVQFSKDWSFQQGVYEVQGMHNPNVYAQYPHYTSVNSTILSPQLPAGTYYYRIRQGNAAFVTNWSNPQRITVEDNSAYRFFNHQNTNLPASHYRHIAVHPSTGEKWLLTREGLFKSQDGNKWQAVDKGSDNNQMPPTAQYMAFDRQGNLWTANERYGISRYNGQKWIWYPVGFEMPDFLRSPITLLAPDQQGGAFFNWGNGQVWYLDAQQQLRSIVDVLSKYNTTVRNLTLDPKGNLWITTDIGMLQYEPKTNKIRFLWQRQDGQAPTYSISNLTFDGNGTAWMGGTNGLVRWRNDSLTYLPMPVDAGTFQTVGMYNPNDSLIWITNGRTWSYNRLTGRWSEVSQVPTPQHACFDQVGRMWLIEAQNNQLTAISLIPALRAGNRSQEPVIPANDLAGGLLLYPNPATTTLNIATDDSVDTVEIFNTQGQCIWRGAGSADQRTLPVGNWAAGLYQCRIQRGEAQWTQAFVKQ